MEPSPATKSNSSNNNNNNSFNEQRSHRSINSEHSQIKEKLHHIEIKLPISKKEAFIQFVARLHDGNVVNYMSLELNHALQYYVESWMSMGEKPKTRNFPLSMNTCPASHYIEKLILIADTAKIQPPFPDDYTVEGLRRVVKITFPERDRKIITKYTDIVKILSEVSKSSEGVMQCYDVGKFVSVLEKMRKLKTKNERDILWKNNFGYKYNGATNTVISFEGNEKLTSIHGRITSTLKNQIHAILMEKYSGRKRDTWSFELSNIISEYVEYVAMGNAKFKHVDDDWNVGRL
jgi:hypothetical protein